MSTSRKSYKNHSKRFNNGTNISNNNSSSELNNLSEMFPDWEVDDLAALLSEHNNLVEIVIDLIVNNKVSKWESPKKDKPKKKEREIEDHIPALPQDGQSNNVSNEFVHKGKGRENFHSKSKYQATKTHPAHKKPYQRTHTKENASTNSTFTTSNSGPVTPMESVAAAQAQVNSWAATLSSDKAKPLTKIDHEIKIEEKKPSVVSEPELTQEVNEIQEEPEQSEVIPPTKTAPSKDALVSQSKTGSWASAITPKPKNKSRSKSQPKASVAQSGELDQEPVQENVVLVSEIVSEEIMNPIPAAEVTETKSSVVLPTSSREIDNVGVSFGSLSLAEEESDIQKVEIEKAPQTIPDVPVVQRTQEQAQQPSAEQQGYALNNQGSYNQQYYQQPQQYNQNKQPQYDYYNQFQQSQQFPQQTNNQAIPGVQYGVYPGIDYSAYNQQVLAAVNGVGSPAAAPANISNYGQYGQVASQPSTSGNGADSSVTNKSPSNNELNTANLQQQQQVPAPYGHPYYSYYYNTPFYGNTSGISQTGFGPNVTSNSAGNGGPNGETSPINSHVAGAYGNMVNNTGHYYGQPNQYSARFPGYAQYPSSNQASQLPQSSAAHAQSVQGGATENADSAQSTQSTSHPQMPQAGQPSQPIMPQYGAYQQYPQYGAYQDNNQYRGWY